jgi:hypothetical protein
MFNVPKSVTHIQTRFNVNQFIMDGNDSINWAYQTQNKILKELNVKKYTKKKSQYENAALGNLKRQEFQKMVDSGQVPAGETKAQIIQKVHTIQLPKKKVGPTEKQGKYIIVDENKFGKGTQIRKMIEDVHKIIIEEGLLGKNIEINYINKKLHTLQNYREDNLDCIRGKLWTSIRKSKKLINSDKKLNNSLIYFKEANNIYVCLTSY